MNGKQLLLKRIRQIVILEQRPLTYVDLETFEMDGQVHSFKNGTIRNYCNQWRKEGKIVCERRSLPVFHTIPGYSFEKKKGTSDYTGVADGKVLQKYMKIFRIHELDKPAIHNIRLKFHSDKLADILLSNKSDLIDHVDAKQNKHMVLQDILIRGILIKTIISNIGTVLVTVACSDNPILFDPHGLSTLMRCLFHLEYRLQYEVDDYYCHHSKIANAGSCTMDSPTVDNRIQIPSLEDWTVTMWHFGQDSKSLELDGSTFNITFNDSLQLFRVYSKKRKVRRSPL